MSDKSGIEWTEATWNPTTGCTKVSPGCKNCYAKHQAWPRLAAMKTGVYTGRVFEDVRWHSERLDQPLRWTRPRRIFVNSMSDLFHEDIPDSFIDQVFAFMTLARQHIFQVLTKRPQRMQEYMNDLNSLLRVGIHTCVIDPDHPAGQEWPPTNVWLGVSVENQETADERIPLLLETPAAVRWLSCEPLLGPIDLLDFPPSLTNARETIVDTDQHLIDWVVVGGESGPNARPMEPLWAHCIRVQCLNAGVPFFMKQGSQNNWPSYHDIDTFPPNLQVREYPICQGHENEE